MPLNKNNNKLNFHQVLDLLKNENKKRKKRINSITRVKKNFKFKI